jgi:carboxypeptidase Taq
MGKDKLQKKRDEFYSQLRKINTLTSVNSLLHWDQSVCMPPAGAEARSEQLQAISALIHESSTDESFFETLEFLAESIDDLPEADGINVKRYKRIVDRKRKLPADFVAERTRVSSLSYNAWTEAKPRSDFAAVSSHLRSIVELNREQSSLLGFEEHPYDALLDAFEPHTKLSDIHALFTPFAEELKVVLPQILEAQDSESSELPLQMSIPDQQNLSKAMLLKLGFSADSARIDASPHPFQTSIGRGDVRVTTRYDENDFLSSLYSSLHEFGHALYEMKIPQDKAGSPLASAVSLGIHESQSLLWEDIIGRSKAFCSFLKPLIDNYLGHTNLSSEELYKGINKVRRSLIRVEADEVTYSMHIMIRLELEVALIEGALEVDDLPDAWNAAYENYLGIRPQNDREGVLQDIHWYSGMFGYFPTYALGKLYSASIWDALCLDEKEIQSQISAGDFSVLREWLYTKVHKHGQRYSALELISNISGGPVTYKPFISYLRAKYLDA